MARRGRCGNDGQPLSEHDQAAVDAFGQVLRLLGEAPTSHDLRDAWVYAQSWLQWLHDTGPDLITNAHEKAAIAARELADDPSLEKMADVLIALAGVALAKGWTLASIANAVVAKTSVNVHRTWVQQADGTWQHEGSH